ncbi:hypothetical protein DI272_01345 [Streptomyces sp. Act143]|nr:hypothetical protein DI272_01345 [Streptomyces sp. Act143]
MHVAPLVLKILITVVVSMVAYVLTNLVKQSGDELWKIAVAVVIGGSTLIVQYMVDFEQRLGTLETGHMEGSRRLEEHFDHLSDAAALLSDLDDAGMSTSDAKRLIKNLRRVGQQGPEIVKAFARSEVESLASVVTDLTGMSAHWPRDNNEWLIRLTQCAQRTIDATSSSVDQRFWGTDSAGPYLDAQTEAMGARRVTIRRLFPQCPPRPRRAPTQAVHPPVGRHNGPAGPGHPAVRPGRIGLKHPPPPTATGGPGPAKPPIRSGGRIPPDDWGRAGDRHPVLKGAMGCPLPWYGWEASAHPPRPVRSGQRWTEYWSLPAGKTLRGLRCTRPVQADGLGAAQTHPSTALRASVKQP